MYFTKFWRREKDVLRPRLEMRRPRYRPSGVSSAWIDPVWRSRALLESSGVERRLTGAHNWIYQLEKIDYRAIASSNADVAVIDLTVDGDGTPEFTKEQVEIMRRGNGRRKKVICYMSIGEAEVGRFYWRREWSIGEPGERQLSKKAPAWIAGENAAWRSYKVKYWDPSWQSIIIDDDDSYLNRIIKAGFDGTYLDIVNGYQEFADAGRGSAATEMIQFVVAIARAARRKNPDFLVIPQNGEPLLTDATFCSHISAIGKEDILYVNPENVPNDDNSYVERQPSDDSAEVERYLEIAKQNNIPVLAVEYLRSVKPANTAAIPATTVELLKLGYVPYFSNRLLNRLYEPVSMTIPV